MLFRRREPQDIWSRMRTWLWPRRSFARSFQYLKKRVLRLDATPHAIAAGFAAGVFASFTPFVGFHFLIGFAIAYCLAGNMVAAALGTAAGNPLTLPLIWAATYEAGVTILSSGTVVAKAPVGIGHALMHANFAAIWSPLLKPMLVGTAAVGGVAALAIYALVLWGAKGFQRRRAQRLHADSRRREAELPRGPARGTEGVR